MILNPNGPRGDEGGEPREGAPCALRGAGLGGGLYLRLARAREGGGKKWPGCWGRWGGEGVWGKGLRGGRGEGGGKVGAEKAGRKSAEGGVWGVWGGQKCRGGGGLGGVGGGGVKAEKNRRERKTERMPGGRWGGGGEGGSQCWPRIHEPFLV